MHRLKVAVALAAALLVTPLSGTSGASEPPVPTVAASDKTVTYETVVTIIDDFGVPIPTPLDDLGVDIGVDTGDIIGSQIDRQTDSKLDTSALSTPAPGDVAGNRDGGNYGPKTFSRGAPNFSQADGNGSFNAQASINYDTNPVSWSFFLSAYLRSIATSNVTANASQFRNGSPTSYDYTKVAAPGYLFHSTLSYNSNRYNYQLGGNFNFRVNVGGRTGTANVAMYFNYGISYV